MYPNAIWQDFCLVWYFVGTKLYDILISQMDLTAQNHLIGGIKFTFFCLSKVNGLLHSDKIMWLDQLDFDLQCHAHMIK